MLLVNINGGAQYRNWLHGTVISILVLLFVIEKDRKF